jgi:hypothetical protein
MAVGGITSDGRTLSVQIPMALKKRGGRKVILAPDGGSAVLGARRHKADTALVKALARAYRWQLLLETGRFATIGDLARTEKVNPSYLARILRLTLLAPDIVEAILDGGAVDRIGMAALMKPFPIDWDAQRAPKSLVDSQINRGS